MGKQNSIRLMAGVLVNAPLIGLTRFTDEEIAPLKSLLVSLISEVHV
jgi:hypothetical protein